MVQEDDNDNEQRRPVREEGGREAAAAVAVADETPSDGEFTLPRSLFIPKQDPRSDLRETVNAILSDKFMAFVALLLVPIIILPIAVNLSPQVTSFLYVADWAIILIFVVEYGAKLYLAEDRWIFFKSPWHLLDLVVVVLSFSQYLILPVLGMQSAGTPSLLLRLLRLPRLLVVGGRAAEGVVRGSHRALVAPPDQGKARIRAVLASDPQRVLGDLTWDDLRRHLMTEDQEWLDVHNVSDDDFARLSEVLQVSESYFKSNLMDEIYPHIDYVQQSSFIFLQSGRIRYPDEEINYLTIPRAGFILICDRAKMVSISRHEVDLFGAVLESVRRRTSANRSTFMVSVLYEILDNLLSEHKNICSEIELEVIRIARTPRSKLPRDFLERIYLVNREVARLVSNLVHFKSLLDMIMSRTVTLEGFESMKDEFEVLQDGAAYLTEIADDMLENLKSIIELYVNQTSFETNRILKILAVITAVGVIPATVGGLLGMNLLDTPFQAYMWQVLVMILTSMLLAVYVFLKLGWLKT